jgi:hypothetical protein
MRDQTIDDLTDQIKNNPDDAELKAKLQKAIDAKKALFPFLSATERATYIKDQREKVMDGIDDTDVQSMVAKEYTEFKKANPNADVITLLDKMKGIAEKQKLMKEIDEDANTLVDAVKNQMTDLAQQ